MSGQKDGKRDDHKAHVLVVTSPNTLKLVEDAVVLIQVAQFPSQVVMNGDSLHGFGFHINVPNLQ